MIRRTIAGALDSVPGRAAAVGAAVASSGPWPTRSRPTSARVRAGPGRGRRGGPQRLPAARRGPRPLARRHRHRRRHARARDPHRPGARPAAPARLRRPEGAERAAGGRASRASTRSCTPPPTGPRSRRRRPGGEPGGPRAARRRRPARRRVARAARRHPRRGPRVAGLRLRPRLARRAWPSARRRGSPRSGSTAPGLVVMLAVFTADRRPDRGRGRRRRRLLRARPPRARGDPRRPGRADARRARARGPPAAGRARSCTRERGASRPAGAGDAVRPSSSRRSSRGVGRRSQRGTVSGDAATSTARLLALAEAVTSRAAGRAGGGGGGARRSCGRARGPARARHRHDGGGPCRARRARASRRSSTRSRAASSCGAGVRRPTTSTVDRGGLGAAVRARCWTGSGAARRHVVDAAPRARRGLVLLDLPDYDSVERAHRREVDRVVELADLLVWVTDPQKYADAALHDGYLRPLAGHGEAMVVVLNQADRLTGPALEACARGPAAAAGGGRTGRPAGPARVGADRRGRGGAARRGAAPRGRPRPPRPRG